MSNQGGFAETAFLMASIALLVAVVLIVSGLVLMKVSTPAQPSGAGAALFGGSVNKDPEWNLILAGTRCPKRKRIHAAYGRG